MTAARQTRPVRPGAVAGALAPPVFLGGLLVLDLLAGRVEVSDHELGPHGWAMHLVFAVTGLLVLALAVALGRALPSRSGRVAAVFTGLWGLGALLGTATPDAGDASTWHGTLHLVGFLLVTLALLPAMVALGVAVRRAPGWRGIAVGSWVLAAVVAVVVVAPATPSDPDYPVWTGPASMLELVLLCAWLEVVALRLAGLSPAARVGQDAEPAATAATS